MRRSNSESLLGLTESFFQSYLRHTRGASVHTIRAYRDALKLFYLFLADQKHKPVADLAVVDIQSESVLAFLNHVESKRGNSAVTRNCRLAAVRSFVQHLLRQDVTRAGQYGRILDIGNKRAVRRTAIYLEPEEARAVIAAVDPRAREGERDHALLLFLYNTGARVSEALAVRVCDLRLERPRQVRLLGKGQKGTNLPIVVRNSISAAPDYSDGETRGSSLPQCPRCTTDARRRRLRAGQVRPVGRPDDSRAGETSCHATCHAAQLCGCTSAGRRRCFRDSRLSWPRIGGHHEPLHHHQPADEA